MRLLFEDFCEVTSSKRCHLSERSSNGVPFYRSKEIIQAFKGEQITDCDYIDEELYESIRSNFGVPQSGDLLVTSRGSIGVPYLYTDNDRFYFADGNLTWLRGFDSRVDSRFLYYWFLSPVGKHTVDSCAKGTAQKAVAIEALKRSPIDLPAVETQHHIASVLMTYDSLIENNRRQIALLEEAAQRLYKEWFVDLRFPGHEDVEIVDGLPEGWQKVRLADCIDKELGGGWGQENGTHEFSEIGYVIRATDISEVEGGNISSVSLRWHKPSNIRPRKLEAGDIVFEVSGGSREHGVGRSMLVTQEVLDAFALPVICASFCKRIKPKQGLSLLLAECIAYEYSTEGLRKFEKRSAGNIINYHWKPFLSEYELLLPDEGTLANYERYVGLLRDKKSAASQIIRVAREARDRLLPKLMSGEIEV